MSFPLYDMATIKALFVNKYGQPSGHRVEFGDRLLQWKGNQVEIEIGPNAYGSNMDAAQMATRSPQARLVGPGQLVGYRFRINCSAVATIAPDQGRLVHGIIWSLTAGDEQALDGYEGVRRGTCLKETLPIRLPTAESRQCLVYTASDSEPGCGNPGYLDGIIDSAIAHGFPASYVEELRSWSTIKETPQPHEPS
jgi:AIG2-like family